MQLKKYGSVRAGLATATCSLLGLAPLHTMAASDTGQLESTMLHYSEKDRVYVTETAVNLSIPFGDDELITVSPAIDVISGASPNGAIPTNEAQAFGNTQVPAGKLPLQTFSDKRYALSLQWQYPNGRLSRSILGAEFSLEQDYSSSGASFTQQWDFNNKLTTLSAGISGSSDDISPTTGVIPGGLTPYGSSAPKKQPSIIIDTFSKASGSTISSSVSGSSTNQTVHNTATPLAVRNKKSFDGLIGITQVINRRTLMQVNYGLGFTAGYLTDPYKIISVVDPITGKTMSYVSEQRPGSRLKQTIYWQTVFHLPKDVIHISYRRYWDDWQIQSDTFEIKYHFKFGNSKYYFEPQFRYYTQTNASFYHYSLTSGAVLPENASADYRLAAMTSLSYGLKIAMPIANSGEISLRSMVLKQKGEEHPRDAIGVERQYSLNPGLEAITTQLSFSFEF